MSFCYYNLHIYGNNVIYILSIIMNPRFEQVNKIIQIQDKKK